MLRAIITHVLVPIALWAAANTAMALTCNYKDGIAPADGIMPLQISAITVGRDVPVGTEVYRQKFNVASGRSPTVECRYAPFQMGMDYNVDSSRGKANWSSGTYADKVYKTNIQGLGVAFTTAAGPLPRTGDRRPTTCNSLTPCPIPLYNVTSFDLVLIKIGDVSPGVLWGSHLPTVTGYANFNTVKMMAFSMAISGNIQIVSRTCNTPNVVVPMGTHQTKAFNGINSATGWKDFSIVLNNCPAFNGTYSEGAPSWTSQSGSYPTGTGTSGISTKNRLLFRIDPARTAINPGQGVLSLDPAAAGSPTSAGGVGIQIASLKDGILPLGKDRNSELNLRNSEGSYSIPLRARYLQTGTKVTPGPANASATFTITYQ